jgi:hypothetical protein
MRLIVRVVIDTKTHEKRDRDDLVTREMSYRDLNANERNSNMCEFLWESCS